MAPVSAAGVAGSCSSWEPWHGKPHAAAGTYKRDVIAPRDRVTYSLQATPRPGHFYPQALRVLKFLISLLIFLQRFTEAASLKPHRHHPSPADAGTSPAGLTYRTGVWMPDTILHLNSCRFVALWRFQGKRGSGVHHFALVKINLHLYGTWVFPKRRCKQRKGAFLSPPLKIPHAENSAPEKGAGSPPVPSPAASAVTCAQQRPSPACLPWPGSKGLTLPVVPQPREVTHASKSSWW